MVHKREEMVCPNHRLSEWEPLDSRNTPPANKQNRYQELSEDITLQTNTNSVCTKRKVKFYISTEV